MDSLADIDEIARGRVGRTLREKWRLDALLGVGGMAAVYAGTHRNGKRGAVKVLHPELARGAEGRARFLREGRVANTVGHPGAVAVIDDDTTEDGVVFMVMELLEGSTLDALAAASPGGTLALDVVLKAADDLLDVLAAANDKGIVHRDIKPENLFLARDGALKVLDFGIARLKQGDGSVKATRTGDSMGTPAFMPPEQALGNWSEVDGRTDLWAVGATMFTLLSGRYVHEAETVQKVMLAAMTLDAPPLETVVLAPPQVSAVVNRALATHREQRFPDARAMQAAVRAARTTAGATTLPAVAAPTRPSIVVTRDLVHAGAPTMQSPGQGSNRWCRRLPRSSRPERRPRATAERWRGRARPSCRCSLGSSASSRASPASHRSCSPGLRRPRQHPRPPPRWRPRRSRRSARRRGSRAPISPAGVRPQSCRSRWGETRLGRAHRRARRSARPHRPRRGPCPGAAFLRGSRALPPRPPVAHPGGSPVAQPRAGVDHVHGPQMRRRRMGSQARFALLAVLLAAAFVPTTARAQGSAAEALFDEGQKALAAGDLETACARFRASDRIDPAPGAKANLAECEEKRGRVATAWELYRTVLEQIPPTDKWVPLVKQRLAPLAPRLPKLVIKLAAGAPADTTVHDGDAPLGTGAFGVPLPLDPGVHHLTVTASGRAAKTFEVTLTMGTTETIEAAPGAPEAPDTKSGGRGASPGPWIVGGAGATALVVGSSPAASSSRRRARSTRASTAAPSTGCRPTARPPPGRRPGRRSTPSGR